LPFVDGSETPDFLLFSLKQRHYSENLRGSHVTQHLKRCRAIPCITIPRITNTPAPNLTDLAVITSSLNEIAQALLLFSETNKVALRQAGSGQSAQDFTAEETIQQLATEQTNTSNSNLSKKVRTKEKDKTFCYSLADNIAFAEKELAQTFEQAYANGNFRDEIRYYYVPAHIVRYEYKLLRQHQQKEILDILSMVYNDLNIKKQLIAYLGTDPKIKDTNSQKLTLEQISESLPLQLLHTIYAHLNSFKLVHKAILPRRMHKQ